LENAKSELLTRLQEIQDQVKQNLTPAEKKKQKQPNPAQTNSTASNLAQELEQAIQQSQEKEAKNQQEALTAE
jgi:hypothetical protein